jgi:hypothetical protein
MSTEKTAEPKSLIEFLLENPQDDCYEYVYPSERFKKLGYKFKIKLPTGKEYSDYRKDAIRIGKRSNVNFDAAALNEALIINHVIEPDFKSAEFLKKAGVTLPSKALYKFLKAGEIDALAGIIAELAGFSSDAELVDQAKNS